MINAKSPFTTEQKTSRKVAYLWMSDNEDNFMSLDNGKFYEPYSIVKLMRDIGFDVTVLTGTGVSDSKKVVDSDANYDFVITQAFPSSFHDVNGKNYISSIEEEKIKFLAKVKCPVIVTHVDSAYSFTLPIDIINSANKYKEECYKVDAYFKFLVQNKDMQHAMQFAASDSLNVKSAIHSEIHAHAINYLWSEMTIQGHRDLSKVDYDLMYVGFTRSGTRVEQQKRLLIESSNNGIKTCWKGIDRQKVENTLQVDCGNVEFYDKVDSNSFLNDSYNNSLVSVMMNEPYVNNQITLRFWEIAMSNSVMLFDSAIPPMSSMKSMLCSKEREVTTWEDIEDILLKLKEDDALYRRLIKEQREVVYSQGLEYLKSFTEDLLNA